MTLIRNEVIALFDEVIDAASKTARSPEFSAEYADYTILLLEVNKIGTPTSETVVIYVVHVDDDGHEYIDADTTHGTITITGSNCNIKKMVAIPYLGKNVSIKAVGGSGLSSSTGFRVSARLVMVLNSDFPDMYKF